MVLSKQLESILWILLITGLVASCSHLDKQLDLIDEQDRCAIVAKHHWFDADCQKEHL